MTASLPDMSSTVNLTDLQLAIVRILWAKGECTVLEVQEALAPERKLAQTTVATILTIFFVPALYAAWFRVGRAVEPGPAAAATPALAH